MSAQANEGSSSGGEESSAASSIMDETRLSKKRARQGAADGVAAGRKIWMRPCNHCGEQLHVRRTRCTACGAAQVSKRAMTRAKEVDGADEEAALGLASFAGASSATPSPEPRRIELTAEQRIKLLRLRKLQLLLARAPPIALAPSPGGVAMLASVACAR